MRLIALTCVTVWCLFLLGVTTCTYVTDSIFAKIRRKEGLLKTLDRCFLANELSLHHTRYISIYTEFLFKIHAQHMHFDHWIVIIMGFFFLSFSSNSIKTLNARKCAQKPTKKEPGKIWPNWIFLRWECSLITSTTGWYLISGFIAKIS